MIPKYEEKAVNDPPHIISTKTTVEDHPFTVAMFVRLQVPYATNPKIKALNKKLRVLSKFIEGSIITTPIPKT